jgi:hypothetical protein
MSGLIFHALDGCHSNNSILSFQSNYNRPKPGTASSDFVRKVHILCSNTGHHAANVRKNKLPVVTVRFVHIPETQMIKSEALLVLWV